MYTFLMATPRPQDVLPLAQEITRLESQLSEAKRKWNALFNQEPTVKSARAGGSESLTDRVMEFVAGNKGKLLTIPEVASSLNERDLEVGRTLYRLANTERISNPKRGIYTYSESLVNLPETEKEVHSEEQTS